MIVRRTGKFPAFFIDESGAKTSSGNFFVVAGIKTYNPGRLQRQIEALRDQHSYSSEFKFSRISRDRLPVFRDLVQLVSDSDARLIAAVVDRSKPGNARKADEEEWQLHARLVARLIVGNMNRGEYAAAIVDHRSTKPNVSFGDTIRGMGNRRLDPSALVSVVTVHSQANDLLQVADLVAGAVANHRRDPDPSRVNHKARVASDLAAGFGVRDFTTDRRDGRVNILSS